MHDWTWGVLVALLLTCGRIGAAPAVLFDAALGTKPSAQGWAYLADPIFGASARELFADGSAILDTTASTSDKAGWFSNLPPFGRHPGQPSLDANRGFVVSFEARVAAEHHRNEHRAGWSVIVTAADLSAIELGFWTNQVWAQSGPDFLHAESAAIDTATAARRYDLEIHGGRYRLSADGVFLLGGELRRYDAFGPPYQIPEFLFFGDDTTSADGRSEIRRITVGDLPRVHWVRDGQAWFLEVEVETGRVVRFERTLNWVDWAEAGQVTSENGIARLPVGMGATAEYFRASLR